MTAGDIEALASKIAAEAVEKALPVLVEQVVKALKPDPEQDK